MSNGDFNDGANAGRQWLANDAINHLSEGQLLALPKNAGEIYNDSGDLVHQDENADPAADVYAALTGDRECHSRTMVVSFSARILPHPVDEYSEEFFEGFLHGVVSEID